MKDWEAAYRAGETPWEKGAPAPPLEEWLEAWNARAPGSLADAHVLVPGCGHGHDVRLLAAYGALALGVDLAPSAIEAARQYPQQGAEMYRVSDFLKLDRDLRGRFAWLFEHTLFCALAPENRAAYAASAAQALQPGGMLVAIWFLNPEMAPGEAGPPFSVTLEEIETLFSPAFERVASWTPGRSYPGREGREQLEMWRRV